MNRMHKVICCLLGLALAVFALPSVAGNDKKLYSLDMEIVSAAPPFSVSATVTNKGNSTINSFQLFVSGMTVTGVTQPGNGTATFTGSSVSVKNMHPLKNGDSVTVNIAVNSCSDGQWSAAVWTGSSLNGQTFGLTAPYNLATSISCGNADAGVFNVPDSISTNCTVSGERGAYDSNGDTPTAVPYFVTNTVVTDGKMHFRWAVDNSSGVNFDRHAAFDYTITCPFGPFPQTYLGWLTTDGNGTLADSTTGTPDLIPLDPSLDCDPEPTLRYAILPAPYAKLMADVGPTDSTIQVDPTQLAGMIVPPLLPTGGHFDIVIDDERMSVTACRDGDDADGVEGAGDPGECRENEPPNVWTVTRHVGGTHAASHSAGRLVMFTPLPIMAVTQGVNNQYKAGDQALMCILDQGDNGNEEHPATSHFTEVIDIGDGHLSGP